MFTTKKGEKVLSSRAGVEEWMKHFGFCSTVAVYWCTTGGHWRKRFRFGIDHNMFNKMRSSGKNEAFLFGSCSLVSKFKIILIFFQLFTLRQADVS